MYRSLKICIRLLVLFSLFSGVISTVADETDRIASQLDAQRCRDLLRTSLIDFYLPHCVDTEFGGYLENLNAEGRFEGGEKFATLQARQLWFFSTLAVHDIRREESLAAAKTGYEFLIEHFHDPQQGGFYSKTTRDGTPTDDRKHVYLNAFVIYGLVEYARATRQPEPLQQAMDLFRVLDEQAYDRTSGGYREFFHRDWTEVTDPNKPGYVGEIGTKTYNTHLHLMEALTELYRETSDELVGKRLSEMIEINTVAVKLPNFAGNVDAWTRDWQLVDTPQNHRISYGHDVECVWLTLEAVKTLGHPIQPFVGWATAICNNAIRFGYDQEHGGFYYSGPIGEASDDTKKEWWTQSEAMVAMLVMTALTGEDRYHELFRGTFSFVEQHHIAPEGGWWATLDKDGTLKTGTRRTSMWQGAYHNGRALLECERRLRAAP